MNLPSCPRFKSARSDRMWRLMFHIPEKGACDAHRDRRMRPPIRAWPGVAQAERLLERLAHRPEPITVLVRTGHGNAGNLDIQEPNVGVSRCVADNDVIVVIRLLLESVDEGRH